MRDAKKKAAKRTKNIFQVGERSGRGFAKRDYRVAQGVGQRRSGGARTSDPVDLRRAVPAGAWLYEPRTAGTPVAGDGAGQRGLSAIGELERSAVGKPRALFRRRGAVDVACA